jgi:hypothetical protein
VIRLAALREGVTSLLNQSLLGVCLIRRFRNSSVPRLGRFPMGLFSFFHPIASIYRKRRGEARTGGGMDKSRIFSLPFVASMRSLELVVLLA